MHYINMNVIHSFIRCHNTDLFKRGFAIKKMLLSISNSLISSAKPILTIDGRQLSPDRLDWLSTNDKAKIHLTCFIKKVLISNDFCRRIYFISPSLKVIDNLKEIVNLTEDIKSQWQDLDR